MFPSPPELSSYSILSKIGSGTFGTVYKAVHQKTQKLLAIKKVRIDFEKEGINATTLREISVLRNLKHENIEKLEDVVVAESRIYMIFEYMDYDLESFYASFKKGEMADEVNISSNDASLTKNLLLQLLKGVNYLHTKNVIHRDLKPQNILVSKEAALKIADFGLARIRSNYTKPYTKEVLSLWYRAPELLLGSENYDEKVDVWSIGCIFGYMVLKHTLFKGENELDQLNEIFKVLGTPSVEEWPNIVNLQNFHHQFQAYKRQNLHEKYKNLSEKGIDLLQKMLVYDPNKRISCKQALMHEYFCEED